MARTDPKMSEPSIANSVITGQDDAAIVGMEGLPDGDIHRRSHVIGHERTQPKVPDGPRLVGRTRRVPDAAAGQGRGR